MCHFSKLAIVLVFKYQKMGTRTPNQKKGNHFLMPTSPQNGGLHVALCIFGLFLVPNNQFLYYSHTFFLSHGSYSRMKPPIKPILKNDTFLGKNSIYHLLNKKIKNTISFCLTRYGLRKPLTGCCHPKPRPPSPSVLGDISLFLYRK